MARQRILVLRIRGIFVRIIEPQQLHRKSIKKKRRPYGSILILVVIIGTLGYGLATLIAPKKINSNFENQKPVVNSAAEQPKKNTFRIFTNDQFVALYSSFAYPNSQDITTPPRITGNSNADSRIRQLAVARGYKLRSVPVSPPITMANGYILQQKAVQPLQDLIAAAAKQSLPITVTAAFRSVDEQRILFNDRLTASPAAISAGNADAAVIETLKATAPPGYSRHHNGFTVDIACGNVGLYGFLETPCFVWLSKDNFKNAKEFGWIPSYPDGINSVGPEPEPWEYVWVGRDALLE